MSSWASLLRYFHHDRSKCLPQAIPHVIPLDVINARQELLGLIKLDCSTASSAGYLVHRPFYIHILTLCVKQRAFGTVQLTLQARDLVIMRISGRLENGWTGLLSGEERRREGEPSNSITTRRPTATAKPVRCRRWRC